jgi:RecJ-like exonuclease
MRKSCLTCASTGKIIGLGQMQKTCPLCEGFGFIEEVKNSLSDPIYEKKEAINIKVPKITIKKSRGRPKHG